MAPSDLTALLDRYERTLIRYACSIVGDLDSARDVVQETFIKLARGEMQEMRSAECGMRNDGTPQHGGNGAAVATPHSAFHNPHLEAWLFTVTRHGALDHVRKHSRIIPMTLPDDRPCAGPGPSATLEQRENADSIFQLLDALSPNQREVIRLKFQNDLSYREIADVTKLSVTNIGFLLHTGLKKLRALLREQPVPDFDLPLRSTP
jgi:RNA polymerase sigma-70 factor (ECF subfamily)